MNVVNIGQYANHHVKPQSNERFVQPAPRVNRPADRYVPPTQTLTEARLPGQEGRLTKLRA